MNTEKTIGVLTYNVPHKKTYDVLCLLKASGYENVKVYAMPMKYKKKYTPKVQHRPNLVMKIPGIQEICLNFNYSYSEGNIEDFLISKDELLVLCGAGILDNTFIKEHTIINAHPGYIPNCRGLDAFKWAIYENEPIGVTTHLLGEYIDAGEIIERREIVIEEHDTFHLLAQRVYDNEISMLVEAVEKINQKREIIVPNEKNIVHKRMPNELEKVLYERFEERKNCIYK